MASEVDKALARNARRLEKARAADAASAAAALEHLAALAEHARLERERNGVELHRAIRAARAAGCSLRVIATHAGMNHETVRRMLRDDR